MIPALTVPALAHNEPSGRCSLGFLAAMIVGPLVAL